MPDRIASVLNNRRVQTCEIVVTDLLPCLDVMVQFDGVVIAAKGSCKARSATKMATSGFVFFSVCNWHSHISIRRYPRAWIRVRFVSTAWRTSSMVQSRRRASIGVLRWAGAASVPAAAVEFVRCHRKCPQCVGCLGGGGRRRCGCVGAVAGTRDDGVRRHRRHEPAGRFARFRLRTWQTRSRNVIGGRTT